MNNSNFPFPKFPWTRSFITRVACISFHPSRNFPDPRKRYNTFVGRSFWRLVMFVYASSVSEAEAAKAAKAKSNNANSASAGASAKATSSSSNNNNNNNSPDIKTSTSKSKLSSSKSSGNKRGKKNKNNFDEKVPVNAETLLKQAESLEFDENIDKRGSEPVQSEFALTQSPNNALITGIRGCGKSHLIMTSAAFLTARNMNDYYRIVCIGDCRAWAQSENPVAYFSLELMMAFRTAAERNAGNVGAGILESAKRAQKGLSVEEGNYNPPGIFTSFADLRSWMEAVGKRTAIHNDLKLVIFIDQLEELYAPVSSNSINARLTAKIFELLISLKYPILIASLIPSPQTMAALPVAVKDPALFAEMRMPAVLTYSDFDMFVEVFEASRKFTNEDDPLMHDLRMWTGAVPAQIAKFFTGPFNKNPPGLNIASRLVKYRAERTRAFSDLILSAVAKMDRLPRMHFLLQICRMILHIPSDDPQLSPGAAINGLESLFLPAALQKFYHPEEGIVAYRHIPTAVSPAAHYTLCDKKLLLKLAAKWEQVLDAVLSSTLNSQNVCEESKRRVIRFYAQFRLFLLSFDEELKDASKNSDKGAAFNLNFNGTNQFNDKVAIKISSTCLRRVIFAGLSPTPILIPSGKTSPNASNPVVFIPGRTDFCFYDFFIALPSEKTLYAVTTCPFETMMNAGGNGGNNNGSNNQGNTTFNTATNAPLTPFTLLEMWAKDLKDAGYNKYSIKSVYIAPTELLPQIKESPVTI
jgi:hypothetical protein